LPEEAAIPRGVVHRALGLANFLQHAIDMARHFALSDFTEGGFGEPVTPFIALHSRWFKHGDTKEAISMAPEDSQS